ncbi:hypothetical protein QBC46DRAFT_347616 [Diplogelasinospora grovesii]|uniref:Uncharacterized protein n=1 Tax=Diplogelasinospora grovesii TaxID=303347 RepID=A0AAN6MW84_9PEZI|nr:hypothetical protein QBC46DRAFT_347616 [Diplogelasinospora grovesii]
MFNEDEFFPGSLAALKDDLLHVSNEELENMLREIRLPEMQGNAHSAHSATTQEEDEELGPRPSSVVAVEGSYVQEAFGASGSQAASNITVEERPDHPYLTARFEPLLTPASTPPPTDRLALAAFRVLPEYRGFAEHARISTWVPEEGGFAERARIPPPVRDNRAIRLRYEAWEAAFNAGHHTSRVAVVDGTPVTRVRLQKILDRAPRGTEVRRLPVQGKNADSRLYRSIRIARLHADPFAP